MLTPSFDSRFNFIGSLGSVRVQPEYPTTASLCWKLSEFLNIILALCERWARGELRQRNKLVECRWTPGKRQKYLGLTRTEGNKHDSKVRVGTRTGRDCLIWGWRWRNISKMAVRASLWMTEYKLSTSPDMGSLIGKIACHQGQMPITVWFSKLHFMFPT